MAIAKRPQLLILDEPVASLDPLARRDFLRDLAEAAAGHQMSVVLSSHLVSDLERACDFLIVLAAGRLQLAGPVTELLTHVSELGGGAAAGPGIWVDLIWVGLACADGGKSGFEELAAQPGEHVGGRRAGLGVVPRA